MVVEGEAGIGQDTPAIGGDFEDLGLAIEEIESDGFERVTPSGHPAVERVRGCGMAVGAGFEDAEGGAP